MVARCEENVATSSSIFSLRAFDVGSMSQSASFPPAFPLTTDVTPGSVCLIDSVKRLHPLPIGIVIARVLGEMEGVFQLDSCAAGQRRKVFPPDAGMTQGIAGAVDRSEPNLEGKHRQGFHGALTRGAFKHAFWHLQDTHSVWAG
jgi:hypothetical protein